MKKAFSLFLIVLIFSCNNNNSLDNIEQISFEKSVQNTSAHENLNKSLKLIGYLTGRAILNNVNAKIFLEDLAQNSNDNTVNFNTIINANNDFSNAFYNEFNTYVTGIEQTDGHNRPRPLIRIDTDFVTGIMNPNFNQDPNSDLNSDSNSEGYQFFIQIINQNNIELYFPRPLILEDLNNTYFTEHLFVTQHPLLEEFPIGVNLWQNFETGENSGEFLLFDNTLLDRTRANIIVVRPSRNREFPYENYPIDFERFYNTN